MWVNTGLLGMLGFIIIIIALFKTGFSKIGNWKLEIGNSGPFIIASMVVIITMGLVDSPYIKNDLAMLFWLLPAMLVVAQQNEYRKDANTALRVLNS